MEDAVLRFARSFRILFLVVIAILGLATLASAGIIDPEPDPGVVPEPTSVLIWLGLMGVVSAATGRRGRRE
jgi:hypothetical protein